MSDPRRPGPDGSDDEATRVHETPTFPTTTPSGEAPPAGGYPPGSSSYPPGASSDPPPRPDHTPQPSGYPPQQPGYPPHPPTYPPQPPGYPSQPPGYPPQPPGYPPQPPGYPAPPPGYPPGPPTHPPPPGFQPVPGGRPPGESSRGPLLAIVGIVVIAAVAIGLWWLWRSPSPSVTGLATPSPTVAGDSTPSPPPVAPPTAVPTAPGETAPPAGTDGPTGAPATSEPGATGGADLGEAIAEVTDQVPPIRGLEPREEVPNTFISPEQLATEIQALFTEENPPEEIAAEEALLKRMGYLDADADLTDLILDLYTSQILAFYRPDTGTFYVVERDDDSESLSPLERITVAHEYTHALQDQHFGLEELQVQDTTEGDRAIAHLALAEGDATLLMFLWAGQNLGLPELLEVFAGSLAPADEELLENMPPILRRQLEFPYLDGFLWVQGVQTAGGWDAVDAAYARPPETTEQVIHPEKYESGEVGQEVVLPDIAGAMGAGWSLATVETLGEMQTQVWLADGAVAETPGFGELPQQPGADVAAGWGGDRVASYDGPDGSWAVAWQTAWDAPDDADEFRSAGEEVMSDLPGAHEVHTASIAGELPAPVLVLIASDDATLARLRLAVPSG